MIYDFTRFRSVLADWKITFSDLQQEQLTIYYEMLMEKNKVMNLTAITEFEDVIEKHFLDSISIAQFIDMTKDVSLIDLGTGAGFPGLPLKIIFPNINITLADSLNKRILFLDEVIDALDLKNIRTVHGRAEELAMKPEHREQYDLCVSRAVANLSSLSEYCIPFVKLGGQFVSYKSIGLFKKSDLFAWRKAERSHFVSAGRYADGAKFCDYFEREEDAEVLSQKSRYAWEETIIIYYILSFCFGGIILFYPQWTRAHTP